MKSFKQIIFLALATSLLAACSPGSGLHLFSDSDGIFSTRPQIATRAFVLIKLSEEPLLKSLKTVDGKEVVDPQQLKRISVEQDQLMAELQKLSTEIEVIYRYRMVLNGLAIAAPTAVLEKIKLLSKVVSVEHSGTFSRPVLSEENSKLLWENIRERNSVKFIGATQAHERGITGKGIKVGVIDTGVDYTHAMFGGAGTEAAFKAIDPSGAPVGYPSEKVVGGVDLVGTKYNAASGNFNLRIPKPDSNPIDEGGHGTHVAGTVAGLGDGVNTYDGVAPDADLYAIKVFGKNGSTTDAVVIAAFEYSVDPNADGDISDKLDVVNLSLGSGYGEGHILYTEAIGNTVRGGVSVVASAGNSGDTAYVVGAPGVADDALSVAASVDNMDHNCKFRAVRFVSADNQELFAEAIEASIAKPIEKAGDVHGVLVYAGLADKDFSDELKMQMTGQVALIDRGGVTFAEKIQRAQEAGAVGVVVVNNQPGSAMQMGGDGEFDIPAIMITQDLGAQIKAAQTQGDVLIQFKTDKKIEKPELIDTMAGFSSKGPRSQDALVKPEIAAPGNSIVSAKIGGGAQGQAMSGTSMAAPHMAGVMALLKQAHPNLSALELKALAVGSAKTMIDATKKTYPVSRQGSGRVQVLSALDAKLIANPVAVSLGEMTIESHKTVVREFTVKNVSHQEMNVSVSFEGSSAISMMEASQLMLLPNESKTLSLRFNLKASGLKNTSEELDGWVKLNDLGGEVLRVPVLAVVNRIAQVKATSLKVASTSEADSAGSLVELTLANKGVHSGDAYLFNLIGKDDRKKNSTQDPFRSKSCDLAEAGYRIIDRKGVATLQVAAKLYEPMTTWDNCEISVLIDADGDGVADQELVGTKEDRLSGLTNKTYASLLLDANKARELRLQYETDVIAGKEKVEEDYLEALVSLSPFAALDHTTIAIVEAPVADLKKTATGELAVKVAASYQEISAIEPDDYLKNKWTKLNVSRGGQAYTDLPEKLTVEAGGSVLTAFNKGVGRETLVVYFPHNRSVVGGFSKDDQSQVVRPTYGTSSEVAKK